MSAKVPYQKSDASCLCSARILGEFLCLLCIGEDHSKWNLVLRGVAILSCEKKSLCVCSNLVKRFLYIYIQSHNQTRDDDLAKYIIKVYNREGQLPTLGREASVL